MGPISAEISGFSGHGADGDDRDQIVRGSRAMADFPIMRMTAVISTTRRRIFPVKEIIPGVSFRGLLPSV